MASLYGSEDARLELPSRLALKSVQGPSQAREDVRAELTKLRRKSVTRRMSSNKVGPHLNIAMRKESVDFVGAAIPRRRRMSSMTTDEALTLMSQQMGGNVDHINMSELGFEDCETEEDQLEQLKRLRDMPCPVAVKRMLRLRLMNQHVQPMGGFKGWRNRQRTGTKQCSLFCKNLSYKFELWRGSFKEIEGHFGSGVLSYFVFLKWLFQLDLLIFSLLVVFVVIPQVVLGTDTSTSASTYEVPCTSTNSSMYSAISYSGDIVPNCSLAYQTHLSNTSSAVNGTYDVVNYIAAFFQGTGFMENTVLFYGYYTSSALNVNIQGISSYVQNYNLPLAYIVITAIYLIISLILMVKQSAQGFREMIVAGDNKYYQYCNKAFGSWDYALSDEKNVDLKKRSIYQEVTHDLEEQRDLERRKARTQLQNCTLWTLRILVNTFVLAALGASGYLIYYVTETTTSIITTDDRYLTWHAAVQLIIEFLPSLTITFLNILVPMLFEKVVRGEDYKPQMEVQLTLFRTVFLRLASLGVLFVALHSTVTCSTKDYCNVGAGTCQPLHCWETTVGQNLYKLVITDLLVQLISTVLVEFPRKLIVSKCSCKLAKVIGHQQFVIPKNVLDLVYSQTLCWLGAFFSPLIPTICVMKFFVVFYTKKLSLLANFVPNERPYRASRSNSFFVAVLLVSFLVCCFPVIYVIAIMTPSRGCGPFRPYGVMYEAITATICDWPAGFQSFFSVVTSSAFSIPVIMVLCVTIYYQHIVSKAQKERVLLLKDQLLMEGKDKQFLISKLNDVQGKSKTASTQETQRQSTNALVKQNSHVAGSLSKISAGDVLYEEEGSSNPNPPDVIQSSSEAVADSNV